MINTTTLLLVISCDSGIPCSTRIVDIKTHHSKIRRVCIICRARIQDNSISPPLQTYTAGAPQEIHLDLEPRTSQSYAASSHINTQYLILIRCGVRGSENTASPSGTSRRALRTPRDMSFSRGFRPAATPINRARLTSGDRIRARISRRVSPARQLAPQRPRRLSALYRRRRPPPRCCRCRPSTRRSYPVEEARARPSEEETTLSPAVTDTRPRHRYSSGEGRGRDTATPQGEGRGMRAEVERSRGSRDSGSGMWVMARGVS